MSTSRLPTYFLSHGGGPWPYMEGDFRRQFAQLEQSLVEMRRELNDAPRTILSVSGHWEETGFIVSSGERPGMVYDYSGFPDHLYQIHYRAPGSPALAHRVRDLLRGGGIESRLDPTRGFDHGTFGIMKPLYPQADIPVVQLSIDKAFDPALHLHVGRLLAPLRDEGVLIVGSGLSYHNLKAMRDGSGFEASRDFDAWLQQTLIDAGSQERAARLEQWANAPFARAAHPREDHLIPLMVAVGAAGNDPGAVTYHQTDMMGGYTVSNFRFGAPPPRAVQ
jgi:aromatic ring-opening dioxygenase catalytic subunit (LigB family)